MAMVVVMAMVLAMAMAVVRAITMVTGQATTESTAMGPMAMVLAMPIPKFHRNLTPVSFAQPLPMTARMSPSQAKLHP